MAQEGKEKVESSDAGGEKGKSPDTGRDKIESSDAGTEKGESSDSGKEKGESSDARQTEHLPQDMMREILGHSEVKPLMGFKLVCKAWQQFIEHPHFKRQHFDLKSGESLFYFGTCSTSSHSDADIIQKDHLLCGCNGMVVKKNSETRDLVIENPSTHQEMAVRPPPNRPRLHSSVFLVYIESTRKYKLFSASPGGDGKVLFHVLTLEEDKDWRPQQFFVDEDVEINGYACTGTFIHMLKLARFFAGERSIAELVTFDMELERFTTTFVEQSLFSDWDLVYILNWNGRPALADQTEQWLYVLIIEEYTMTHRLARSKLHVELNVPDEFRGATPLLARKNFLWMQANQKLLSYDVQKRIPYAIPDAPSGMYYDGSLYIGRASLETVGEMHSQHGS